MGIFDNRTPFFDEHFWYRIVYDLMHEVKRVKEEARLNGLTAQEYVRLERLVKLFHETHDYYAQPATRWTQEQWRKEQDAASLAALADALKREQSRMSTHVPGICQR